MIEQVANSSATPQPSQTNVAVVDPPVAPSIPILGAAPEMLKDATGFVLRTARELGPLFRIPLGPRTLTLIGHPDDLRRILQEQPKEYPRGKVVDPCLLYTSRGPSVTSTKSWRLGRTRPSCFIRWQTTGAHFRSSASA